MNFPRLELVCANPCLRKSDRRSHRWVFGLDFGKRTQSWRSREEGRCWVCFSEPGVDSNVLRSEVRWKMARRAERWSLALLYMTDIVWLDVVQAKERKRWRVEKWKPRLDIVNCTWLCLPKSGNYTLNNSLLVFQMVEIANTTNFPGYECDKKPLAEIDICNLCLWLAAPWI